MRHVGRSALAIAALSVLPLIFSVASELSPHLAERGLLLLGPRFLGPYLAVGYAGVLMAVMSGMLIGFALPENREGRLVLLPLVPALWPFLFAGGGPFAASLWLIAGFALLLGLDWLFWRRALVPVWWFPLRAAQSVALLVCLTITATA